MTGGPGARGAGRRDSWLAEPEMDVVDRGVRARRAGEAAPAPGTGAQLRAPKGVSTAWYPFRLERSHWALGVTSVSACGVQAADPARLLTVRAEAHYRHRLGDRERWWQVSGLPGP